LISNSQLRYHPKWFSLPCGPLRLNFHDPLNSRNVVTKAAPRPQFRTRHQASTYRIAMNIAQLLDALSLGPDVEVVVAGLPERSTLNLAQLPRNILFEHLQCNRKLRPFRFGDQQMNMLWHDHVSRNVEPVPLPCPFQSLLEDVAGSRRPQARRALITAKRERVQTPRFLKSLESPRHALNRKPTMRNAQLLSANNSVRFPGIGKLERESKSPPCLCQPRQRQGRGTPVFDF